MLYERGRFVVTCRRRVKNRPFLSSRWTPVAASLAAAALSLFTTGCPEPADLEHPEQYCKPGGSVVSGNQVVGCSDSGASSGTGGAPAASCESACMKTLLTGTCNGCHNSGADLGGLDLESADYTSRLKGRPATHEGVTDPSKCNSGDLLIDAANPTNSWLLKKVNGQHNQCGDRMPSAGAMLSQTQIDCVTAYVTCVGGGT